MTLPAGVRYVMAHLQVNPDASLEDVRERAQIERKRVHTESFRRARIELGLDPAPPERTRPAPAVLPAEARPQTAAVGSTQAHPSESFPDLTAFREQVAEVLATRDRYRAALEAMREVIRRCL